MNPVRVLTSGRLPAPVAALATLVLLAVIGVLTPTSDARSASTATISYGYEAPTQVGAAAHDLATVGHAATTLPANTRIEALRAKPASRTHPGVVRVVSGFVLATKAGPQALRPLADNAISAQKQAGHVPGTPQNIQRLKAGKRTSTFFRADQAEELTRRAWSNGVPVAGRSGVRDFEFGFPVGRGTGGGLQTSVRVHIDNQGRIHGHPVGRELVP